MFHAVGTDVGGNDVDFTIPMMFVSISDIGDSRTKAIQAYNESEHEDVARRAQRRRTRAEGPVCRARPGCAERQHAARHARAQLRDGERGARRPRLLKADVNIPQVQELLGSDAPDDDPPVSGLRRSGSGCRPRACSPRSSRKTSRKFLRRRSLRGPRWPPRSASRSRATRPAASRRRTSACRRLSRALGPLAGKVADAVNDAFDPTTFFQKGLAQLFGTFDLFDLLPPRHARQERAEAARPSRRTSRAASSSSRRSTGNPRWTTSPSRRRRHRHCEIQEGPRRHDQAGDPRHDRRSPLTLDALGAPVAADVTVRVRGHAQRLPGGRAEGGVRQLQRVRIHGRSGAKTDVTVKLDPATPLEFAGDLKFVEELRKIIPPDLFGDGPSLDLSPTGIRAGFSFALPPVAVGVFALKDVSLGAALTLPVLRRQADVRLQRLGTSAPVPAVGGHLRRRRILPPAARHRGPQAGRSRVRVRRHRVDRPGRRERRRPHHGRHLLQARAQGARPTISPPRSRATCAWAAT